MTRSVCSTNVTISVPGVSLRLAFSSMSEEHNFFLFNKKHKDLVSLFLENNVGGPALIFDRWQEVGELDIICLNTSKFLGVTSYIIFTCDKYNI